MHSPQFAHAHRTQHVITTRVRTLKHVLLLCMYSKSLLSFVHLIVLLSYCCSGDCQLCVVPAALLSLTLPTGYGPSTRIAESKTSVSSVPLNGANYPTWKVLCRMALACARDGLCRIVSGTETEPT